MKEDTSAHTGEGDLSAVGLPTASDPGLAALGAAGPGSREYRAFLKQQGVIPWDEVPVEGVHNFWRGRPDDLAVSLAQQLPPAALILDYGCGAGRHLRYFNELGFRVIGVDPYETGPTAARAALPGIAAERIELDQPLPFPDQQFIAVLSTYAIYHGLAATVHRSIAECIRVVQPRGLVYMTLLSTRDFKFGRGPCFEPNTYGEVRRNETGSLHHFFTLAEVLGVFKPLRRLAVAHQERPLDPPDKLKDPTCWQQLSAHWIVKGEK